ncbi:MAG: hypothetical protein ACFFD1_12240 [Candidatus Thorarchaeota archaeon]
MKKFSTTYIAIILIFSVVISSLLFLNMDVGANLKHPDEFENFDPTALTSGSASCSCHDNPINPIVNIGTGIIEIGIPTEIPGASSFAVNLSVKGFVEAADDPEGITVGLRTADKNNSLFIDGTQVVFYKENEVLDSTGNTTTVLILPNNATAPAVEGNYTLEATAVYWNTTNDDFYYIKSQKTIKITAPLDSGPPVINAVKIGTETLTNNTKTFSGNVNLAINVTDDVSVKNVSVALNDGTPTLATYNSTSTLYDYAMNTYLLPNGPVNIKIIAFDGVGNMVTKTYTETVQNTGVKGDITAYKMDSTQVFIGNGKIDDYWNQITDKFVVEEFGGTDVQGYIKAAHDANNLYLLIAYSDELSWIAMELNATQENMENGHDGWVIGNSTNTPDLQYFGDVYFTGDNVHPTQDKSNDVSYEIIQPAGSKLVYVEFKRPLITGDTAGYDIELVEGNIYNIKFASSKPAFHKSGVREVHTLAISQAFPQSGQTTNTTTTTTTTQRTPEQIRTDNINNFVLLATLGVGLNLLLIAFILVSQRRKLL